MQTYTDQLNTRMLAKIELLGSKPHGLEVAQVVSRDMVEIYLALHAALSSGEPLPYAWRNALARILRDEGRRQLPDDRNGQYKGLARAATIISVPQQPRGVARNRPWTFADADTEDKGEGS